VFGHVYLGGAPVSGAVLRVDGYRLPEATGKRGGFSYRIDDTLPGRHQVRVVGTGHAAAHGRKLTSGEAASLRAASGGFSVGYQYQHLRAKVQGGNVVVSGRIANSIGTAPVPVGLFTYRLSGTITDVSGKPVAGAVVVCRTADRDFWTF